jgi:hypothetical protein
METPHTMRRATIGTRSRIISIEDSPCNMKCDYGVADGSWCRAADSCCTEEEDLTSWCPTH